MIVDMPTSQERRDSERIPCNLACLFECTTPAGADAVKLTEGAGHVINRSAKGMLLLLPENVNSSQMVEIQIPSEAREVTTTTVVEVRWTRPIEVDAQATMYLAGTRFLFELPVSSQPQQIH
jgi:PilZ domain